MATDRGFTRQLASGARYLRSHQSSERIEGVSLVPKDELQAVIEARRELGSEMEPAVIDAFVERVERRLDERVEEREKSLKRKREHQKEMVLGAMGISIPLLAIAAIFTGFAGVLAVCVAVAVIAIASTR
jgi:Flp pilus assembly protein TadB